MFDQPAEPEFSVSRIGRRPVAGADGREMCVQRRRGALLAVVREHAGGLSVQLLDIGLRIAVDSGAVKVGWRLAVSGLRRLVRLLSFNGLGDGRPQSFVISLAVSVSVWPSNGAATAPLFATAPFATTSVFAA